MGGASLGEDTVTEKVKRRVSKWDLAVDPQYRTETVQDNSKSGDLADSYLDEGSNSGCNWSKSASSHAPKWSGRDAINTIRSEYSSGGSYWEPMPERKYVRENEGREKFSPTARTWGGVQSRGASITSRIDAGRHRSRSCSRSPHGASITPHIDARRRCSRSRSRSPGWGRSYRFTSVISPLMLITYMLSVFSKSGKTFII